MRSAPADLVYGNIGRYFASHGFITIIPDYRLAPETPYPGGAEDLRVVLEWTTSVAGDPLGPAADRENILIRALGGARNDDVIPVNGRVKGAFIASALTYYDFDVMDEPTARGVEVLRALPPLALLTCERDPECMRVNLAESRRMLEERSIKVPLIVAKGHNRVSITFALRTGQGERWAEDVVLWMRAL
ncbi:hypothetical protein B0H14DRAFT_2590555 [Mycena olivaceomarginata]|nr:hypothetical protein B0H14DRAFT_2590555 [Mycena olivaceomarginata]